MKRFLLTFTAALAVLVAPVSLVGVGAQLSIVPNVALAAGRVTCADGTTQGFEDTATDNANTACASHGGVGSQSQPINSPASACPSGQVELSVPIIAGSKCVGGSDAQGGVIVAYLKQIIKFAAGAIGGVIILMLIIAGIQYIVSAGDPGAVKNAKNRIVNAITALVLFAFMYAILNFLIPGGIFG